MELETLHSLNIRLVTIPDIPLLAQLWLERMAIIGQADARFLPTEQNQTQWSQHARSWVEAPNYYFALAQQAGEIQGYVLGRIEQDFDWLSRPKTGHILQLILDAHTYHGGLARLLVQHVTEWFATHDAHDVVVHVPTFAPVEQAFWRAMKANRLIDIWRLK